METTPSKNKKKKIIAAVKKRGDGSDVIDVEEKQSQFVIFTIGGSQYAFDGEEMTEILDFMPITYVPGSPDFILGIINVRGNIESVISINSFIGLQNEEISDCRRIIIAEKNGIRSGILVKDVEDVLDLPEKIVHESLSTLSETIKHFVKGEFEYNGKTVVFLNLEKIFEKICEAGNQGA
ncbi:MAG: purine-binding chemotaxis protein CheW [Nitrospinae bacterium]|nr:purine-binding chemotaxis protein CheW [Nitrospinota bacterium]